MYTANLHAESPNYDQKVLEINSRLGSILESFIKTANDTVALIPFAFKAGTETLVDISEVARGKACDCICPSCSIPLIARHCTEDREDHFAHDPAFKDHKDYIECDFSLHVAMRLMLKQLLAHSTQIALPDYSIKDPYTRNSINVTQARTLEYENIEIEQAGFDAVISKDDYQLGVFISYYPGRMHTPEPSGSIKGIVQLDISNIAHIKQKSSAQNSKDFLSSLLSGQSEVKSWYWHANQEACLNACKRQHIEREARNNEPYNSANQYYIDAVKQRSERYRNMTGNTLNTAERKTVYRCYLCCIDYPQTNATNTCPHCEHQLWKS